MRLSPAHCNVGDATINLSTYLSTNILIYENIHLTFIQVTLFISIATKE